ncbi:ATP-binding protein [Rubellimicrobium roseum]|uniref:histidine kinase n=1 Tax=Rubellimicrobium roseum TaxID=687525 RepID=A0A5C4NHX6_9RHOB|nr:ATP-binding protein [Rubellimicrobium roseum]TNC72029.1 response regulator [Rubellimicrobium roseum]
MLRRALSIHVVATGTVALVISMLAGPTSLGWGSGILGATLFAVVVLERAGRAMERRQVRIRRDTALSAIRADRSVSLLTDAQGRILGASDQTRTVLGSPETMEDVLRPSLADPKGLMDRLMAEVGVDGHARLRLPGPCRTRDLTVQGLGSDLVLWRLGDEDDACERIPTLVATPAGAVIEANDAFRHLVGEPPDHLDLLVLEPPLVAGSVQALALPTGVTDRLVAQIEDGERQVILLLPPGQGSGRSMRSWDTIEDFPVPLLKLSRTGSILAANRHARALLPTPLRPDPRLSDMLEGMGRPLIEWLSDVAEGRPTSGPQVLRGTGAHQDTVLRVSLSPSGPAGDRHLIAVLDDVSEYKALEAQFVQSQKMQALGQLAGGVAHDFNNLLTAILGHCDLLLLRHDQGDPDYADLIQVRQNVNRAASLVGQLLAFSRKQSMMPETLDLRDVLSDLTHLLNRLVGEKVRLALDHDPGLLHVRADRRQLEQVVMNLIVNARDAMPDGGEIRIETGNLRLNEPRVLGRATISPGRYVLVRVIDEGLGIPPERLPKIFEPFYTTKKPGEGTGLGLSTAYGIMKQTGGYIFAESVVGEGTTFSLWFPAHENPTTAAPVPADRSPPRPAQGTILLAEDEAPVRAFAARALRLRGHHVIEADSAAAALEAVSDASQTIDLILSDVVLPDMDGPTWVRQGLKLRPGTKVIFASGYAEEAFGEQKALVHGSAFLPKPFSLATLCAIVEERLACDIPDVVGTGDPNIGEPGRGSRQPSDSGPDRLEPA